MDRLLEVIGKLKERKKKKKKKEKILERSAALNPDSRKYDRATRFALAPLLSPPKIASPIASIGGVDRKGECRVGS